MSYYQCIGFNFVQSGLLERYFKLSQQTMQEKCSSSLDIDSFAERRQ